MVPFYEKSRVDGGGPCVLRGVYYAFAGIPLKAQGDFLCIPRNLQGDPCNLKQSYMGIHEIYKGNLQGDPSNLEGDP